MSHDENGVTQDVTTVTFSENLLRSILPLTPDQQIELVTEDSNVVSRENGEHVSNNDTAVSFTEGLLRSILSLIPDQQIEAHSCDGCLAYQPKEIKFETHERAGMWMLLKVIFSSSSYLNFLRYQDSTHTEQV